MGEAEKKDNEAVRAAKRFNALTAAVFNSPDGREWLKQLKLHRDIRFYTPATVSGGVTEEGTQYWDGVKAVPLLIECILLKSEIK